MTMKPQAKPTLALRIATVMQMMGIEGLPRNYELVYEAYAATDPALLRSFKMLGKQPLQSELDDIGRKFLPHHFEAGSLEVHTGRVKGEMAAFLEILEGEKNSLAQYGQLVGEAMETMSGAGGSVSAELAESMRALGQATRERQERTETISRQVTEQTAKIEAVGEEVASSEMQKFTDPLTGLGNRRMFNKELAGLFKADLSTETFGVAVAEVAGYERFVEKGVNVQEMLRVLSNQLRASLPPSTLLCRFDGGKFGILYLKSSRSDVERFARRSLAMVAQSKPLQAVPVAIGACMSEDATDGLDVVTLADKALREALTKGGGSMVLHTVSSTHGQGKNFALYEVSSG